MQCGMTCECCDGEASYNGRCYHRETANQSWGDALVACQARGAGWDLAGVEDEAENDFIFDLTEGSDTWIGMTDVRPYSNRAGTWVWSGDDPSGSWDARRRRGIYANFRSSEPDGSDASCARIHDNQDGEWGDRACSTSYDSMCEGPMLCSNLADGETGGETPGSCAHDPCVPGAALNNRCDTCVQSVCDAMPSCCSDDWDEACVDLIDAQCDAQCECADEEPEFDDRCFFAERVNRSWSDARESCQERGHDWDLASVRSSEENDFLDLYNGIKDTWIGITNGNGVSSGNEWKWASGDPPGSYNSANGRSDFFTNFAGGEPGSNDCVIAKRDSGWEWADESCSSREDSMCAGPKNHLSQFMPVDGATSGPAWWTQECVDLVGSECGARCTGDPTLGSGQCTPWYPGQVDETCTGIDLAVGVPCGEVIPVCNHGQFAAPAGVRIVHFPANSQQYPKTNPDQTHPQMFECFTEEVIPPGECIDVVDCPRLTGNREIMVNPEGAAHVPECTLRDNWSLYSKSDCVAPICSGGTSVAVNEKRPVDIIFMIDNSGSMKGEIEQVQDRINADFASIIGSSAIDYRVIMMSRYGDIDTSVGDSKYPICIGSPLGADDCSAADSTELVSNPPHYFHFSTDVGSWDALCRVLEGYDAPDELARDGRAWTPLAPRGYSQWLRQNALKVFVVITDDDIDCFHRGVLLRDNSNVEDGQVAASLFDDALLALSPEQFGTIEDRKYVFHSIVAMSEYSDPLKAWPASDPIQTGTCSPGSEGPGTGYQALSRMTGGLRYPTCRNDDFDAIFRELATSVVDRSAASCFFTLENEGNFDISTAKVVYADGRGGTTTLTRRADVADCGDSSTSWYLPDPDAPGEVQLCPATCEVVEADDDARIGVEVGCAGAGFEPFEFSEVYQGRCKSLEQVQWSFFAFEAVTPSDTEVVLEVRSAPTEAELVDAVFGPLAVANTASGNTNCADPATEGCPVDLYEALEALGNPHHPVIEIRGTLNPSSDQTLLPALERWELSYSCPDAQ